jgi:hypothetical protein
VSSKPPTSTRAATLVEPRDRVDATCALNTYCGDATPAPAEPCDGRDFFLQKLKNYPDFVSAIDGHFRHTDIPQ